MADRFARTFSRSLYQRDSLFMRSVSAFVALTFTMSLAGSGFVAPAVAADAADPAVVTEAPAPVADAPAVPAAEPAPEAEPAPSIEAAPTTTEPLPDAAPGSEAAPAAAPAEGAIDAAKSPVTAEGGAGLASTATAPKRRVAPSAGALVSAAAVAAPYAGTYDWEAYRLGPPSQVGWSKSQLDDYVEGDWVPVRVFVKAPAGQDLRFPGFSIRADGLMSSQNAIGIDKARGYRFFTASSLPAGASAPGGAQDISGLMSIQNGTGSQWLDLTMATPAPDLVVPAGQYGVVYFQVHLAITPYWQAKNPSHYGAGRMPGGSTRLQFLTWNGVNQGANAISLKVERTIQGNVLARKWHDVDHDTVIDSGEVFLPGWELKLSYLDPDFPFTLTGTTGADGTHLFEELPPGSYELTETLKPTWQNSTPLPLAHTLDRADQGDVLNIGNYQPPVTKTWSLAIDNLPAGAQPFVRYSVNGAPSVTTTLTGSGPYTADVDVPLGATISNIGWYVLYAGSEVLLGTSPSETLSADKTNSFTYDASVAGKKFNSETEDGLSGWTIVLKRVVNSVETTYAQQVTGAGGAYSFSDVLPGTYKVYEIQQAGWMNTVAPTGSFAVANGTHITGKDFGNLFMVPRLNIVKTGSFVAGANGLADVGELINYTFVVTNTGNVTLSGITVTDPKVSPISYVSGDTDGDTMLDLTEAWTYTGSYAVTQADIDEGSVYNMAMADSVESDPDTDDETVTLPQAPAINIVKTGAFDAGADGLANVGELITYSFAVTNPGNVTLSDVAVTDPKVSPVIYVSGDTDGDSKLDLTETWNYTGTYAVTQADIDAGKVDNTATATGTPPAGQDVSDSDDETVTLPQDAKINIVKTGAFAPGADGLADVGELITYSFDVTNAGNVTLTNVVVTDPKVSPVTYVSGDTDGDSKLDLTETWHYTGTYAVTQADIDAGSVYNLATADSTESGPDTDDETVALPQDASIALEKSGAWVDGDGDGFADVGESVLYTFSVTNTGNVTLYDVTVTDPKVIVVGGPLASLAPGATNSGAFIGSYAITQADIDAGSVYNLATTTGYDPDDDAVTDDDDNVAELPQNPVINIVKTGVFAPGADGLADVGELITYTFAVSNPGNVSLSNVVVTDPKISPVTYVSGDTDGDSKLDVTETWMYTGTYAVTQADIDAGSVYNLATADSSESGPDSDDETVTLPQDAKINIVKSGSFDAGADGLADEGELITYTFTVTNPGNVTLSNVVVTDPKISPVTYVSGDTDGDSKLDVTETWIYTGTYAVTQADIDAGKVDNTATATGTPPEGQNVSDSDDETVTLPQDGVISIVKTGVFAPGADGFADVGELITYTFTVTNPGNVSLSNVTVTDPKVSPITYVSGDTDGDTKLDLTETWTYTGTYAVTQVDIDAGSVYNLATADADESNPDSDEEIVELPQDPSIMLEKNGMWVDGDSDGAADPGELITYAFTVTNNGNVTLTNVTVTDPKVAVSGGPITLAPGQVDSATFTGSYVITQADIDAGSVYNLATATGIDPNEAPVSDDDDDTTELPQSPAINIVKTGAFDAGADGLADVGELITYSFAVTNPGNVTLSDVVVTDPKVSPVTYVSGDTDGDSKLDVTETWIYTGTYAVTQADIDAGKVDNTATATGTPPAGQDVSDSDDETVTLPQDASITLEKSGAWVDGDADGLADVGESVLYTFSVTNTGNVTLYGVTVTDPKVLVVGGPLASLAPGATNAGTFIGSYAITQADIDAGSVFNVALATGTPTVGDSVSDTDDNLAPLPQRAAINIVKTGSFAPGADGLADVGELITYTFAVTNTGNVTLSNVVVTDPKVSPVTFVSGDTDGDTKLDLTETWTYTGTYAVTQADITATRVDNTATATGTPPQGQNVTDSDDETIDVIAPAIAVVKTVSESSIVLGESVTYTYTVTNTGNVELVRVALTDDILGAVGTAQTLPVGGSATFTLSASPSRDTTNVVTAVGFDRFEHEVRATDDAFVEVGLPFTPPQPDLKINKSADKTEAVAGETVTYKLTYENVGIGDASDIVITDDFDERYMTVTDTGGGTVSGGKLTWNIAGPLSPADGPQTITYKVRIASDLPASVEHIDNVVVVSAPDDTDSSNNTDTWRVNIPAEPFLPFTGGNFLVMLLTALAAVALGLFFRRAGTRNAS